MRAARRLWLVTQLDLEESLRRPFFLFWVAFMGWNAWLVSRGIWLVRSNSTSLGGNLAYVNSEFQIAYVCAIMGFFILSFFVAIAAGTPLIRDAENKVGEILHSTPLSPGEYVWGKFLGVAGTCLAVLALFVAMVILFTHGMPNPERPEAYGPFALRIYVVPILVILLPTTLFVAGLAFALGRLFGRPILIFFVPVLFFVFYWSFFWGWNPPEMSQTARFWFQMIDPSGFRWLRQTYLTVDRGIAFYNSRPIDYSPAYLLSRSGWALAGLALVDLARRHFAGRLKTARKVTRRQRKMTVEAPATAKPSSAPLGALGMTSRARGFLPGTLTVARFEVAELFSHPALYVLIPLLLALLLAFFVNLFASEFGSMIYLTPGVAAAGSLPILTGSLLLLLLFYTVESLRREIGTGAAAVVYTTPVKTSSLLLGKALANAVIVAVALLAAVVTAAMVLRNQGSVVDMDLAPFAVVWSLLLAPTLILWVAFLIAAYAASRSQYATYAAGFVVLFVLIWAAVQDHVSWVGNWALVATPIVWTDMGRLPMDREALVLNRLMALGLAALLFLLAFRLFARQDRDPLHPLFGRQPGLRRRTVRIAAALAVVPLALGFVLWGEVNQGYQGGATLKKREDYWRFNHATWLDAPTPYITNVEMDLDLDPATRGFKVSGFYDLRNEQSRELPWFPVTIGTAWKEVSWTLDGRSFHPEDSHGLQVFRLARPLAQGGTARLGFRYEGTLLPGISRKGGPIELGEFITSAGGVVTGRNPEFVPVIGYDPAIGVAEEPERRYEPKTFPPGWYRGVTEAELDKSAFTHRLRITLPAEYMLTSTGALESNEVRDGRRTVVWVDRLSGAGVQHRLRSLGRAPGKERHGHLLPSRAHVQRGQHAGGARRRPALLLGVVLSLSLAGAAAERVSQPRAIWPGQRYEHLLFRGRRFSDAAGARARLGLPGRRARSGALLVGACGAGRRGPGRGRHVGGHRPLRDDDAHGSNPGTAGAHRLRDAGGDRIRRAAAAERREAARRDLPQPAGRRGGDLRQGLLGRLDAPQPHGPGTVLRGRPRLLPGLSQQSGSPRGPRFRSGDAALRRGQGGL